MALDESIKEDDNEYSFQGIKFLISNVQARHFSDTKLDFVKGIFGKGQFKLLKM